MQLTSGTRFGSYEITAPLGAGGMGEVYRARDTNLKRDVAIKVLPAALANDAERLARFQREAELLAALNHPNIAQIYGLERSDGTTALVMELISGQTLIERLAHGALPVDEALAVAQQIADALAAAHERGIVHRDLKPANVQLTPDGAVKVLDFGIAKALDTRLASTGPAVLTTPAMTEAGIVLGTAPYMSPEQARGKPVDQRADIWAFGCVLYELLTGQLAFGGDDVTLVLARVLERSPDFAALPKATPPAVRRTLEICLEKDPKKRIADIRDVRLALAGQLMVVTPPSPLVGARRRWWPEAASAFVLGAMVVGIAAYSLKPEPRPVVRAIHQLPEGRALAGFTTVAVAMAPNGTAFVFNTVEGLYLRSLDTLEERLILAYDGVTTQPSSPVFSPDGEWVAYFGGGQLRRVAVSGGGSVALAPAASSLGISWQDDGTILYAQGRDGIWQVPAAGGVPQRVVDVDGGIAMAPQRLPGGEWILFTFVSRAGRDGVRADVYESRVASVTTGEQRTLRMNGNASGARYVATGHLLYSINGVLYAAPFDAGRLEFTGGPVSVIEGVRVVATTGVPQLDVSENGDLVYLPGPAMQAQGELSLLLADRGGTVTSASVPARSYVHVRASTDGERVALDGNEGGEASIWIYDLAGTRTMQRLALEGRNQFPVWSPDGERLAFQSTRGADAALWAQRVDGTSTAQRLTTPAAGEAHIPEAWSPDNQYVAFAIQRENVYSLALLSLRDGAVVPFGDVESAEPIGATFSSDGKWIAYHVLPVGAAADSPSGGVFVEPFPPTGARYQVPKDSRDFQAVWSRDGPELYYIPATVEQQIAVVRVSIERGLSFDAPTTYPFFLGAQRLSGQTRAFDVLPGSRFVGLGSSAVSETLVPQVRFVLTWFEELKRLAPTE
jgi:serine/threonine-protein kinase